jgi:hypothetical protein
MVDRAQRKGIEEHGERPVGLVGLTPCQERHGDAQPAGCTVNGDRVNSTPNRPPGMYLARILSKPIVSTVAFTAV